MLNHIKAVIFDLDGTLIDSMWLWETVDIEYLKKHGHELPDTLQDEIEGMSFSETANYFKKRFNIQDDVSVIKNDWNEMAKYYYNNKVTLKPYAKELLQVLKTSGIKVGIATSNSKELVSLVVERFQLDLYLDTIRTSCEVDNGKPAPDVYLKVAEDIGVLPEHCLVFEDVYNGVMAGKNAKMTVCAVYDDFSSKAKTLLEKTADYYIDDFSTVIRNAELLAT